MLFEQLLSGLPDEYSTTRAVIDAQSDLTVQEKLYTLTKQEDRLTTDDTQKALAAQSALAARNVPQRYSKSKRQPKHDSGSESEDSQHKLTCWACKAHGHLVRDCPMLSQLQTIVKTLSSASLRTEKTKNREPTSNRPAKGKAKSVKDKTTPVNTSRCRYKGHIASNDPSDADTESSGPDSSESDEDEVIEVAAHS
jgi:hypothetical protein